MSSSTDHEQFWLVGDKIIDMDIETVFTMTVDRDFTDDLYEACFNQVVRSWVTGSKHDKFGDMKPISWINGNEPFNMHDWFSFYRISYHVILKGSKFWPRELSSSDWPRDADTAVAIELGDRFTDPAPGIGFNHAALVSLINVAREMALLHNNMHRGLVMQ